MKCPYCSEIESKVVDKRETSENTVRRRRECLKCAKRYTTYEKIESADLIVIKKDGRRESFNREKLKAGLLKACEKRPVSIDKINKIADDIEAKLRGKGNSEVKSSVIGELVMGFLKRLDKIAYIRFASVYKDFTDLASFKKEVEKLIRK